MNPKLLILSALVILVLLIPLANRQAQTENRAALNGKMVDRATSAPVAAEVGLAMHTAKGIVLKHAQANTQGEFQFTDLPAGEFHLSTKHDGYAVERAGLALAAGETRSVDLSLRATRHVSGVIADERGAPLADAKVQLFYAQSPGFSNSYQWEEGDARTDEQGRFTLAADPDRAFVVQASRAGYLSVASAPSHAESEVALRLTRGVAFSGVVNDEQGNPLPGAQVELRDERKMALLGNFRPFEVLQQCQRATVTQVDGTFRFENVGIAPQTLTVTHPQMAAKRQTIFTARRTVLKLSLGRKH
jgi:hypothetical protein